jgi:hypothetical protein
VQAIRDMQEEPTFGIEVIMASSPDTVEISLQDLVLKSATYDVAKVSGELSFEQIYVEPLTLTMTPQRFPGLF